MSHFDEFGGDEWICQGPEHQGNPVQNSRVESQWRPDITGHESAGNACPSCVQHHEDLKPKARTLPVGTKGWFETKFNNADVFEIVQDTPVVLESRSEGWYQTVGSVPGFPAGHPRLLIWKEDIDK